VCAVKPSQEVVLPRPLIPGGFRAPRVFLPLEVFPDPIANTPFACLRIDGEMTEN